MYNIVRNQRIHNFVGGSSSELRTNEGRAETEKRKMTKETFVTSASAEPQGFTSLLSGMTLCLDRRQVDGK